MFRLGKAKRLVDWLVFLFSTDPNEIQFHVDVEIVTIQATHNQYIIQKVISKFYIKKIDIVKQVYRVIQEESALLWEMIV